jgi:predicted TIM-barrel fold metal-dependent hydrolase
VTDHKLILARLGHCIEEDDAVARLHHCMVKAHTARVRAGRGAHGIRLQHGVEDASQLVQIHTHVPIWASNMQLTAQLLIQAGACRNMPSLKYVHTHAGLQYVHVHAWF